MFKKGDIVICIDNGEMENQIILYKEYIVEASFKEIEKHFPDISNRDILMLKNIDTVFVGNRFRLLSKIRREKIENIERLINDKPG